MPSDPEVGPGQYRCAACKQVFEKGRTDEEAQAEALANGYDPTDNCDVVCDVCYHKHFASRVNRNGAAAIEDSTRELLAREHGPHELTAADGSKAWCSGDYRSCKFCAREQRCAPPIYLPPPSEAEFAAFTQAMQLVIEEWLRKGLLKRSDVKELYDA